MIALLKSLRNWSNARTPHSWVMHGAGALPMLVLPALTDAVTPLAASAIAVSYHFFYRELEQMAHRLMDGVPLFWTDHVADVAVPTAVACLAAWLL